MVYRFLKHDGTGKADEALSEFVAAVDAFDPHTASKAEVMMMQAELSKLAARLAETEVEVEREHQETIALETTYDRYLDAARSLERAAAATNDMGRRIEIEASLIKLIDRLERLNAEISREQHDDRDAEVWACKLRNSLNDLTRKLDNAEGDLRGSCSQGMSAALDLTTVLTTVSVALASMNKETARIRAEREAIELKAESLRSERLDDDPNIAAALNAATPSQLTDGRTLSERLERLEDRPASPAWSAA